jgi:hypothetical protein
MTRTPYDQFSKQFLEELLSPLGEVKIAREVPGEARQVDVWFSPASQSTTDPEVLGLLGRLAASPCLLEPFRKQPTPTEVRNCLLKLFLIQAELQREAERNERRIQETDLPKLWILASSASETLLNGFRAYRNEENWSPGVYLLGDFFRAAVVAINQLPQTQATLWLRILGKGKTQQQAIAELVALPKDNRLRTRTLDLLLSWSISIEGRQDLDEEDRALIMQLSPLYQERLEQQLEEGQRIGRQQGQQEGMQAERRTTIENLLRVRYGSLDTQLSSMIEPILQLSTEDYTLLLLQLSNLSREDLLSRFQNQSN